MDMYILRKEELGVAIINPRKAVGENGQYHRYDGNHSGLDRILDHARASGFEIRRYVENIAARDGGIVPIKYVLTELPPMYVQPFHSHHNVDEINLIQFGEAFFIESDTLTEHDIDAIRQTGALLRGGDVVVSESGKRHTVANLSKKYVHIIGTISAKESVTEFKPDWIRLLP